MQTLYASMIENTVFLGILGLERGLKIFDQIFFEQNGYEPYSKKELQLFKRRKYMFTS